MSLGATVAIVGAGALLGIRHATDADHVVAISTLVQREPRLRSAVVTALAWGVGHSLSFLAVGTLIVATGVRMPASVAHATELLVGLTLIGLGVWHLTTARAGGPAGAAADGRLRSFLVGVLHGLGGSGAVALVALTTLPSRAAALVHLGAFALGTIAGMAAVTAVISRPLAWSRRSAPLDRALVVAASLASVAVGLVIVLER